MIPTGTKFTDEQRRAIQTHKASIALSAGAGCGKTFVLTERFLSHLEPAGDEMPLFDALAHGGAQAAHLHELVAITFTDRAAREMRDRIRKKCFQRLQTAPARDVAHWLDLLRSLDAARVSTIHAFCGALLRSHAVEAQLDPHFFVIEQAQADTLLAEIIEDTLREKLAEQDPPTLDLTARCGLKRLQSMLAVLADAGRTIDFEAWLDRTPEQIVQAWDEYRQTVVVPRLLAELAQSASARELLSVIRELGPNSGELQNRCAALSDLLPNLPKSRRPGADLDAIVENARVQGAGSNKSWPSEALHERFKTAAEQLRKDANDAKRFLEFDLVPAIDDAKAGLQLLTLAKAVLEHYESRKHESAWLDFNDLLVGARNLLIDPAHSELQQQLTSQLRLLLVDECQDTDPVQVELIKALCGDRLQDGKLFFVGDYKQSIYRFRGADPNVFRQLQESTPKIGRLPLTKNFRSQPAILEFVNALFCDALATDGLAYQALIPSRPQVAKNPTVEFLWATIDDMTKSQAGARDKARRKEAEFIARRIRRILDQKEPLVAVQNPNGKWATRGAEKRDIAILFRTLSDVQHYEEALRKHDIDYYLVGGHAFYAQQEIYDIVNLLRALASPADEISLAGVLRSPMFGLSDETLFRLAEQEGGLSAGLFSDALPSQFQGGDLRRIEFVAETLRHLRSWKDRLSITDLLNEALALTGYDAVLLAEFLGERKLANLRKLQDQARTFDQSGGLGLSDFIVQLSQFVVKQPREPLAATQPEETDVVRLMTIHQAKGLEFPIVFVPDMGRTTHTDDRSAVWDERLGPLVKLPSQPGSEKRIGGFDLQQVIARAEDEAERIRLLYVAMTRAADYLVLSAGTFHDELTSPTAPWLKLLGSRFNLESGEIVTSLPEGYPIPQAKVTRELPSGENGNGVGQRHDLHRLIDEAIALSKQYTDSRAGSSGDRLAEPIAISRSQQRQFSVSRLTGELRAQGGPSPLAVFPADEGEPLFSAGAAADLGTLVHQILARISLDGSSDLAAIVRLCAENLGGHVAENVAAAEKLVAAFAGSARFRQLATAKATYRELEFLLAWPSATAGRERSTGEIYLQGFIDCLYQDANGGWHLVDYKTNRVAAGAVTEAVAQFETQLGVYALAVEQILGAPPAEVVVHLLRSGEEYRFHWSDDMRRRTVESVTQAIQSAMTSAR